MIPAPAYLAPTWRYAGDDWAGTNALTFYVYSVAPVLNPDGTTTPGTLMNLTGFSVSGTIYLRQEGRVLPAPDGAILGDPSLGTITLSLSSAYTAGLPWQELGDWADPSLAVLLVRPRVTDPSTNTVTVGLQPLFVFQQ